MYINLAFANARWAYVKGIFDFHASKIPHNRIRDQTNVVCDFCVICADVDTRYTHIV